MAIKNVVFDFGGVIMDWSPFYFFDDYFKSHEKAQWFIDNICTSEWNSTMDKGVTFKDAADSLSLKYPEYTKEIHAYTDNWDCMLKGQIDEGVTLLQTIANSQKYNLYGLTNWSYETFPRTKKRFPIFEVFKGIIVSGEVKHIKPEKEIYFSLLNTYGLKAEECLFIDDNINNINAAKALNFQGIHFDNPKEKALVIKKLLEI